ncbi:MAG TPA: hypothetical protein VLT86_08440 [Vicinamibacterales bacterium]|nr:hypothetical protein [Vicinamibacterales bacterium]
MTRRRVTIVGLALALWFCAAPGRTSVAARLDLPPRLADQDFWRLIDDFSEPNGSFRSDNLVSNEDTLQFVLPELTRIVKPGGVYLGVGPDQNFTYIAALEPRMAFITDIRRGNLQEHLMYKALFELSADRAEFLSRLFSRKRPGGLDAGSSAEELFAAFNRVEPSRGLYEENLQAIKDLLVKRHGFRLTPDDVQGIAYVYENFFGAGPSLAYAQGTFPGRGMRYPTYQDLQTANDGAGQNRAYLGSEGSFRTLKTFEEHNLLVPIVGNFAGPKALRAVGAYLKAHDASVSVFYLSNVEQYLFGDGIWLEFAHNIEALPLAETSTFIRSCFNGCASSFGARSVMLLDSMPGLLRDARDGKIRTYADVLWRSR